MNVYLPIRNLGDFMITASVVKNNAIKKVPIILPQYLNDIFAAIDGEQYFDVVGRIDYDTQPAFFEFYKVKDLPNVKRLLKDIQTIYGFAKKHDKSFLLDYRSRRLCFAKAEFKWPSDRNNIYQGKLDLLVTSGYINAKKEEVNTIQAINNGSKKRVLILPDSRIASKKIDNELVTKITGAFPTIKPRVAHFSKEIAMEPASIQYSNFRELIALLSDHDLIISAESLPYHLANYLNKPHFVVYNKSRHFKESFMTPFMLSHNYYASYDGKNSNEIIERLKQILQYTVDEIDK